MGTMTEHARLAAHLSRARGRDLPATLTLAEWTRTIADFNGLCAYCESAPVVALEHFVPISRGGGTTAGNCLPSCLACDDRKSGKHPDDLAAAFGADRIADLRGYLASRSTGQDVDPRTPREQKRVRIEGSNISVRITAEQRQALELIRASEAADRGDPALTTTDLIREFITKGVAAHDAKKKPRL